MTPQRQGEAEVRPIVANQNDFSTVTRMKSECFWVIWSSHEEHLFRLSLRWMQGNWHDAEEALSSAKLKAALHSQACKDGILNHRAWLGRLLYNVCMDLHRRRAYMEETGVEDFELLAEKSLVTEPETSPEAALVRRELSLLFIQILRDLPAPWRSALVERCLRERSYKDIAGEQSATQANIRKRVQLARAVLQENMASGKRQPGENSLSRSQKRLSTVLISGAARRSSRPRADRARPNAKGAPDGGDDSAG